MLSILDIFTLDVKYKSSIKLCLIRKDRDILYFYYILGLPLMPITNYYKSILELNYYLPTVHFSHLNFYPK